MTKIKCTDFFIVRYPTLPASICCDLDRKKTVALMSNPTILKAVQVASPVFIEHWNSRKENDKLIIDKAYQYLVRMSSRTLPFGAFTSAITGKIQNTNSLIPPKLDDLIFNFYSDEVEVDKIYKELLSDVKTLQNAKFFLNPTIRFLNSTTIRLWSWKWEKGQRDYQEVFLKIPRHTFCAIKQIQKDLCYIDIAKIFTKTGVSSKNLHAYVMDLLEHKIIFPDFHPRSSGFSSNLNRWAKLLPHSSIKKKIEKYRSSLGAYTNKNLATAPNNNVTVMVSARTAQSLSHTTVESVRLTAQNMIRAFGRRSYVANQNSTVGVYKKEFLLKFGTSAVPLLDALSLFNATNNNNNSYLADGLLECFWQKRFFTTPPQDDLPGWNINLTQHDWVDLFEIDSAIMNASDPTPSSGTIYFSLFDNSTVINRILGWSAAKMISRYCLNDSLLVKELSKFNEFDRSRYDELVFAELENFDTGYTANISKRPPLLSHEIRLFSGPDAKLKNIKLNDLYILLRNNRFVLYSDSLKKEIVPQLSAPIWPGTSIIPAVLYRFLALLRSDLEWPYVKLMFGNLEQNEHLPRITFGPVVCRPESWLLDPKRILAALESNNLNTLKLPDKINWIEYDRKTPIFFKSDQSVSVFKRGLKKLAGKSATVYLEEIIYDFNSPADAFNEIVLPFYNETYIRKQFKIPDLAYSNTRRRVEPDCIYFQFYCSAENDYFLSSELAPFLKSQKINNYFFIRFDQPDYHLRLRIFSSIKSHRDVHSTLWKKASGWLANGIISDFKVCPYIKELEIYSGPQGVNIFEKLSVIDTRLALGFLKSSPENRFKDHTLDAETFDFLTMSALSYAHLFWPSYGDHILEIKNIIKKQTPIASVSDRISKASYQDLRRSLMKRTLDARNECWATYKKCSHLRRDAIIQFRKNKKNKSIQVEVSVFFERMFHLMNNRIFSQNSVIHETQLLLTVLALLEREQALAAHRNEKTI